MLAAMIRWNRGETTLTIDAETATLRRADGSEESASATAVATGEWDALLFDAMDQEVVAEARAVAAHHDAFVAALALPPVERRPRFSRRLSGRPDWVVWFWGREVQIRVPDVKDDLRVSMSEIVADGLPETVAALPAETRARVVQAAVALSPLPCMCGTGCDTPEQHGSIERLGPAIQHPNAPTVATIGVGACTVCGRLHRYHRSGDSHYSFMERRQDCDGVAS